MARERRVWISINFDYQCDCDGLVSYILDQLLLTRDRELLSITIEYTSIEISVAKHHLLLQSLFS